MSNIDTPLSHETNVRQMLEQLQGMRGRMPKLVDLPLAVARRMFATAATPDRFFDKTAVVVEQVPPLARTSLLSPAEYRDVIVFTSQYEMLANDLEQLAREVRGMILVVRHDGGQEALRVYRVARSFNRPADRQVLVPYIDMLQEALGRTSRSRSSGDEEPPVTTTPPPAGNGNGGNK